jgi:polysaccharide deacetylase family protein (PEP-CTERM system associated)
MRNALTIDLEDWYHPELVRPQVSEAEREGQIARSTQALLDLLRDRSVEATFFVVGQVIQRQPRLAEAILTGGHELACHGMSHKPLWQLTADEFGAELQEFDDTVANLVPGAHVIGFRAPTFSLDNRTRWALNVLHQFGYRYDSSVFPFKTPLYGVSGCPLVPYRPSVEDIAQADDGGSLVEFPMSVWTWGALRVPVCGGFYLRALPFRLIRWCLQQINRLRPFAIYVHPWETYKGTPRVSMPLASRFVTYFNIDKAMRRLTGLLDTFSFAPMRTVLEEMGELAP